MNKKNKVLEGLWTHSERKIGSNGDLRTEMDISMGVADSKHGIARGQGLGSHPTAVVLAWGQPPWIRRKRVGGS